MVMSSVCSESIEAQLSKNTLLLSGDRRMPHTWCENRTINRTIAIIDTKKVKLMISQIINESVVNCATYSVVDDGQ
jgi:dTDP-4-dehydrorhamnose reductase